jgi:hypothetical protein
MVSAVKEATGINEIFVSRRGSRRDAYDRCRGYFPSSWGCCVGGGEAVLKLWRTLPLVHVVTPATVSQCPFAPGAQTIRPSIVRQSRPSEPMHWVTPLTELQLSEAACVGVARCKSPRINADVAAARGRSWRITTSFAERLACAEANGCDTGDSASKEEGPRGIAPRAGRYDRRC